MILIKASDYGERGTEALRRWYEDGADGAINWGEDGDFEACVAIAGKYIDNPEGYCNERHQAATGAPPGKAPGESDASKATQSKWSKHPNNKLHDQIVAYYSPKIAAALKDQLKSELPAIVARAKKKYEAATKASGDTTDQTPAQIAAQNAMPTQPIATSKDLQNLMRAIAGDSYVAGVHASMGQIPTAGIDKTLENLMGGLDWDEWEPGWAEAADLTKLGGWTDIMSTLQYTFDGITQTNMDRIESQLAQSLASGDSVDTLSNNIADMVGSDSRADLIANTETARMMSMATQDSYQAADIGKYTLLTEDDACQECLDLSDDGNTEYDVDDDTAMPPIHPRCRCAMLPVVVTSDALDVTTDTSDDDS